MRRRTFLQAGGAALLAGMGARSWAADVPTTRDLAGDVAILREALKLHPGLYRYQSPAAFEAKLARFGQAFVAAGDQQARFLALAALLAEIRCGHSYPNFFNQKKEVAAELFDRPTRVPVHFVWVGDEMVVVGSRGSGLAAGTRIHRLNGERPAALRARLMPLVRADGHNDAKRISLLEVRGDDRIETFDVFQGLLSPPRGGVHRLEVEEPDAKARHVELPAIGLAARQASMTAPEVKDADPLWTWSMRPDGVAVLTMPGWGIWNSKWDWKGWLDARLDSLGGTKGLVVDLRDNEGGADCGDLILARLIDRPWTPPALEQRLRFRRTPASLDPFLDTWDDSFRTLGERATPLADGFFLRPAGENALRVEPADKRLPVGVAVLTSPVNSSATFQFARNFRAIGGGKLYGRPTGGNRRGINGGCFFFVRLPASGLEFDLPLVGYFAMGREPDAGIIPDVAVAPTIADLAAGRDRTLERAAVDLASG
ncbi:S41 family peptidase [Sphingomonas rosea]|uniref:S41 family peptidase n=1 Tax=Sphingomonas rosea TaxID=335605 RepID=A0ABP7U9L3_9SPHN